MVIGHMKAHKAINRTSVPLLTMHMLLYPHGDRSYEAHKAINTTSCTTMLTMHNILYPHGDRSYESTLKLSIRHLYHC